MARSVERKMNSFLEMIPKVTAIYGGPFKVPLYVTKPTSPMLNTCFSATQTTHASFPPLTLLKWKMYNWEKWLIFSPAEVCFILPSLWLIYSRNRKIIFFRCFPNLILERTLPLPINETCSQNLLCKLAVWNLDYYFLKK